MHQDSLRPHSTNRPDGQGRGLKPLLIGLACLAFAGAPARADILWGVNGHPLTSYPGVSIQQQLEYLQDLGMTSYRVDIEHEGQVAQLGELVREGKARGIEILPVITPASIDLDKDDAEELYDKAYELAVTLVTPFKDDIRVWELGNEMENYAIIEPCEMRDDGTQYPCEWGPAGGVTALEYYGPRWAKVSAVLKGLSDGTMSVDPTIRKAMGTAGWGHVGAFDRMRDDGIKWDISVWHYYGDDPEWAFEKLATFHRPIWVTEFHHPRGSEGGDSEQAAGLERLMARLRALQERYDVEAAHLYELMDEPYWAPSFEAVMGLVRLVEDSNGGWTPGEPKPAYRTVKELIRGTAQVAARARDCDLRLFNNMEPAYPTQVTYSYCLALGRQPDGHGFFSWQASLKNGASVEEMLMSMLLSDEFRGRYATFGLTNAEYVALLYRLLLGREPDDAESSSLVARLDGRSVSRSDAMREIVSSSEFAARHRLLFVRGRAAAAPPETGEAQGSTQ